VAMRFDFPRPGLPVQIKASQEDAAGMNLTLKTLDQSYCSWSN
jgi:hypothetical protein